MICPLCANVSETEAKVDVEEVDRADADPDEVVALYVRVSTAEQSLDRQRQLTYDYATDWLGVEPSSIQVYTDKRSGTNTDRSGYADLMNDLASGEIDRVVVSEVSRLSRSVRDFAEAVERIVDEHGAALHVLDMGLDLNPTSAIHTHGRFSRSLRPSLSSRPTSSARTLARDWPPRRRSANRPAGRHSVSTSTPRAIPRQTTISRRHS